MDAELKSLKNEWDKIKGNKESSLQIIKDKNLLISNAKRSVIKETIISSTPSQRRYVLTVFATYENYLCELTSINQPVDEETIKNVIYGIFIGLEKKK
jgi:hypothetical protein